MTGWAEKQGGFIKSWVSAPRRVRVCACVFVRMLLDDEASPAHACHACTTQKKRFFVLTDQSLKYFADPTDKQPKGFIPLIQVRYLSAGACAREVGGLRNTHSSLSALADRQRLAHIDGRCQHWPQHLHARPCVHHALRQRRRARRLEGRAHLADHRGLLQQAPEQRPKGPARDGLDQPRRWVCVFVFVFVFVCVCVCVCVCVFVCVCVCVCCVCGAFVV
jgi:hypothetical protein